jgi:hypothetical protein
VGTLSLAGCGGHSGPSPLERAALQRRIDPATARCIADVARRQLGNAAADHLASELDHLPPALSATLTKITSDCAVTSITLTTPTTTTTTTTTTAKATTTT